MQPPPPPPGGGAQQQQQPPPPYTPMPAYPPPGATPQNNFYTPSQNQQQQSQSYPSNPPLYPPQNQPYATGGVGASPTESGGISQSLSQVYPQSNQPYPTPSAMAFSQPRPYMLADGQPYGGPPTGSKTSQRKKSECCCGFSKTCCIITWVTVGVASILAAALLIYLIKTGLESLGKSTDNGDKEVSWNDEIKGKRGPDNKTVDYVSCYKKLDGDDLDKFVQVNCTGGSVCQVIHPKSTGNASQLVQGCSLPQYNWHGCHYIAYKNNICQCGSHLCNKPDTCVCNKIKEGHEWR